MLQHKTRQQDHHLQHREDLLEAVGITPPPLLLLLIMPPAQVSSQPGVNPAALYSISYILGFEGLNHLFYNPAV